MSFTTDTLEIFGYVRSAAALGRHALSAYATNDTAATVEGSGYFDAAAGVLPAGSLILVQGDLDGTPFQKAYVVASNNGSAVSVTPGATVTYANQQRVTANVPLTDGTYYLVVPGIAGDIAGIKTVLQGGAVSTNDAILTFKIGTTAITNGVVTIAASGSAAGDVDTATPSGAKTITTSSVLAVTVSNTPGGSRTAQVTFIIDPS
ncbi:MAG TPA: hypothetical protein PLQ12_06695 [Candidatus Defluviicoccus seviourii]|nr:hypothetical protein [Candidatus Defluviicoccus seviourii]